MFDCKVLSIPCRCVAHNPGEGNYCAGIVLSLGKVLRFFTQIKGVFLNEDSHDQPPVIGGKNATSLAPLSGALNSTNS